MTESSIANIGFGTDTTGLEKAVTAQEKLITVSGKTEKATDKLLKKLDGLGNEFSSMNGIIGLLYQANLKMAASLEKIEKTGTDAANAVNSVAKASLSAEQMAENAARASAKHAASMAELRAKYNPLYAASRQYEIALRDIADAERIGAINAREAADARLNAATAINPIPMQNFGKAAEKTGHYVGQLGYQLNDIGMMMALGQSPFMLMMQQGPQISQLFDDMRNRGLSLGSTIKDAFLNMLSPMTFVTLAVIGVSGTIVQYFTGAGEATKSLEDKMGDLSDSVSTMNEQVKIYSADGIQTLIDKYGEINVELLAMIENQTQFSLNEAMSRTKTAIAAVNDELSGMLKYLDAGGRAGYTAQLNMQRDLKLTVAQAFELREALKSASEATDFQSQQSALRKINGLLAQSSMKASDVAGKALEAESAVRQLANSAPQANWMSGAVNGLTNLGAAIRARLGEALALRATMPGQGKFTPQQLIDQSGAQYGGRGGDPRNYDPNSIHYINPMSNTFDGTFYDPKKEKGGGGGSGSDKMQSEIEKLAETFSKLSEPFGKAKSALDAIDEALANGSIGVDQYSTALGALENAFLKSGGSAGQWAAIMARETESVAKQLKDLKKSGVESLGDAIGELAVNGQFDFGQLAKSIIKDLINITWQAAVTKPLLEMFGLSNGAVMSGSANGGSGGTGTMGLLQPFAKGSAFTNSIATSPTLFAFANGGALGVMGEAGPEAVMPLKRGPDGSLGVQMHGAAASGGGGKAVVVQVINNADNTEVSQERQVQGDGSEIQRIIIDTVNDGTANGEFDTAQAARYGNRQGKVFR